MSVYLQNFVTHLQILTRNGSITRKNTYLRRNNSAAYYNSNGADYYAQDQIHNRTRRQHYHSLPYGFISEAAGVVAFLVLSQLDRTADRKKLNGV